MNKIKIIGGRVIDPASSLDQTTDIFIADQQITAIGTMPEGFGEALEINAQNLIICPGLIDLSARLREPGQTDKGDIQSESKAAAAAGFTSLCLPPDTKPVIDSGAVTELIRDKAEHAGFSNIYPIGALTSGLQGNELSAMFSLKEAGCIAFSNANQPFKNLLVLHRAMEYAASHDLLVIYQATDHALSDQGCAHDGSFATRYGLPGIPEAAETLAVAQCLELIEQNQCRVHFTQLSCARSVNLIDQAKQLGLPVSADVALHQLVLCEDDILPFDSAFHVIPPLRSQADRDGLRQALLSGTLDAICSAHQPHDIDAKLGAFPETEAGISALDTVIPLLSGLVAELQLSWSQALQPFTAAPAKILNLPAGRIELKANADLCLFDPNLSWRANSGNWVSRGTNSPFQNQELTGKAVMTLQSGRIIYQNADLNSSN